MRHVLVPIDRCGGLLLAGCATVPTGPSVMVLPGNGKDFRGLPVRRRCVPPVGVAANRGRAATGRDQRGGRPVPPSARCSEPPPARRRGGIRRSRHWRCRRLGSGIARRLGGGCQSGRGDPVGRCSAATTSRTCSACTPRATRSPIPAGYLRHALPCGSGRRLRRHRRPVSAAAGRQSATAASRLVA